MTSEMDVFILLVCPEDDNLTDGAIDSEGEHNALFNVN